MPVSVPGRFARRRPSGVGRCTRITQIGPLVCGEHVEQRNLCRRITSTKLIWIQKTTETSLVLRIPLINAYLSTINLMKLVKKKVTPASLLTQIFALANYIIILFSVLWTVNIYIQITCICAIIARYLLFTQPALL